MHRLFSTPLTLIILPLVLFGCKRNDTDQRFSLSDFEQIKIETNQIETIDIPIIYHSSFIRYCTPSSFVISSPRGDDNLLVHYDMEAGKMTRFVSRGRGPEELLGVSDIHVNHDTLYVYSIMDKKELLYDLSKGNLTYCKEVQLDNDYMRIVHTPEGGYLGLPYQGGRLSVLSSNGKVQEYAGSFPIIDGTKEAINNMALQSLIEYSPNGQHLCSVYQSIDCIEIYDESLELSVRLFGPEDKLPSLKAVETRGGMMFTQSPQQNIFYGLHVNERNIIVGYIGQVFSNRNDINQGINSLLCFNWKGQCKQRYVLPFELVCFDIDHNGYVIGLTNEESPRVIRFPLK